MANPKKGNIGTFTVNEFFDIIDELSSGSKNAKSKNGEVDVTVNVNGNASKEFENITNKTKDASTAMENFAKTSEKTNRNIETNTKRTANNVIKEYEKLTKFFSSGMNDKHKTLVENVLGTMSNADMKKATSYMKKITKEAEKYKRDIESIKEGIDGYGSYVAKGKQRSTIAELYTENKLHGKDKATIDLFDENLVKQSANNFRKQLEKSGKKVDERYIEMYENREKLIHAFHNLKERTNFNETDFSDRAKNKELIENASKMVKIAKQVEYMNSILGAPNESYIIDINAYEQQADTLVSRMVNHDTISQIFSQQFKSAEKVFVSFGEFVKQCFTKNFEDIDATGFLTNLEESAESAIKKTEKVVKAIEEVKDASSYVKDVKKLTGVAEIRRAALDRKVQTDPNKPNIITVKPTKSIADYNEQRDFVGQYANLERQRLLEQDKFKDRYSVEYYRKLVDTVDEFKQLRKEILNSQPVSSDPEKIDEELKARKALNDEIQRKKELGLDMSGFEHTGSSEPEDIEAQTQALREYNDEQERAKRLEVDSSKVERITGGDIKDIQARTEALKEMNDEALRAGTVGDAQAASYSSEEGKKIAEQIKEFMSHFGDPNTFSEKSMVAYTNAFNEVAKGAMTAEEAVGMFNDAVADTPKNEQANVEKLQQEYLELFEIQRQINDFREKYPREDVEWFEGYPVNKSDFTNKGSLASILKKFFKNEEVKEILDDAKYNLEYLDNVFNNYEAAYSARNFGEDFNDSPFEKQLAFFENIAKGNNEGKKNYKKLQEIVNSGHIVAELLDGTTKDLSYHDIDLKDTFGLYEKNLKGNIKNLRFVMDTSVDDLHYSVESNIADLGNVIGRAFDKIQPIVNEKLLNLFNQDIGLKIFDNIDENYEWASPFNSDVEEMDFYGLISQAENSWRQTEEFKNYYEKYSSLIDEIYNWNEKNVEIESSTWNPILVNTDNIENSISAMEKYRTNLQELMSDSFYRVLTLEESTNITDDIKYLNGLIERTKELQAKIESKPTLPLNEESTGQLAFQIDGVKEASFAVENAQESIREEVKETNEVLEGQIGLFDYLEKKNNTVYHAGTVSKLNKAETNGRFYGSNRDTGYYGTGHYFVDSNTRKEIMSGYYGNLPFTSVDISQYDNLFKADTDEKALKLHEFLKNLTKYTQGNDLYDVSELFEQFEKVFGTSIMTFNEFEEKIQELTSFMQNSDMSDRSDSVSTQFMKSLGYGGVDTRGTRYADTRYGTVIYDLKEESILQANITDELQKQGDMMEKLAYEKGEVWDNNEDKRIQGILDEQNKQKSIESERNRIFDITNLQNAENELNDVESRLREIDNIINNCTYAIYDAEEDARRFAKETEDFGLNPMSEDEILELANQRKLDYQERIDELSKEKEELQSQIPLLEEKINLEYESYKIATEQAKKNLGYEYDSSILDKKDKSAIEEVTQEVKELTQAEIEAEKYAKEIGKTFGITSKTALKEIADVVLAYRQSTSDELATDENGFLMAPNFDDESELFENAGISITKVLEVISEHIKSSKNDVDAYLESWKQVRKYISNSKIDISDGVKSELGDDWQSMLSTIGRGHITTDGSGTDIITFLSEMNSQLGTTFDLTVSNQDAFRQLYDFLKNKPLDINLDSLPESIHGIVNQILDGTYNKTNHKYNVSSPKIVNAKFSNQDVVDSLKQEEQTSTSTADTFVENEKRKQKAVEETVNVVGKSKKKNGLSDLLDKNSQPISEEIQELIDAKIAEIKENVALDGNAKYKIATDANDSPVGVNITYKDKDTQSMITEMYSFKSATEETEEEYEGLVLKRKEYVQDEIKLAEQRVQSEKKVQKALEQSNSFLSKQKIELKKIRQDFDKNLNAKKPILNNPNVDKDDQDELQKLYSAIESKISTYEKNQHTLSSKERDNLLEEIAELKLKKVELQNKYYGSTTLSPTELSDNKSTIKSNYDYLISKAKEAGSYTSDLVKRLEAERITIDSIGNSNGIKVATDHLKSYRAEFVKLKQEEHARITQQKANNEAYKEQYKIIESYSKEQDHLNTLLMQQEKKGKSNELTAKIDAQTKKVEELKIKAEEARNSISKMFKAGSISTGSSDNAINLFNNVRDGKTASFSILEGVRKDSAGKTKNDYSKDLPWMRSEVLKHLKGFNDELGTFEKLTNVKPDGTATITFVKELADSTERATVQVKDLLQVLIDLQNGSFDPKTAGLYKITEVNRKDVEAAYKTMIDTEEDYRKLSIKRTAGTATQEQLTELKEIIKLRNQAATVIKTKTVSTQKEIEAQQKYNDVQDQTNKKLKGFVDKEQQIKSLMDSSAQMMSGFAGDASKQNIDGFDDLLVYYQNKINDLNEKLLNTKNPTTANFDKYKKDIANIRKELDSILVGNVNIEDAEKEMRKYFTSIGLGKNEIGKFDDINKTITATFEDQDKKIHNVTLKYDELTKTIKLLKSTTEGSKSFLTKFIDGLKGRAMALGQYLLSFASFYDVINKLRQGIQVVRDLDLALTEMRKVSDETVSSLRNFQDVSFDVANSIGTTAVQIQNSAADFMRLGFSLKEASELAKDANIYANVGDMEIDEATEHMISSIKAWESEFSSEVEASEAIIDRYNEIGNNFAISSADIGSAMERSAAALKAGGNTLNESLGLITAGNIIQQDAETTAAALKILSLRIRGSKAELEEMGESTDDLASSSSKLREEIKALTGVDIMADENTYKSTAKIIEEIGAVWDKLSDVSQAATIEKIAGKNRASTVAGLLENYEVIGEVIEAAENAEGSALRENERYLESIEGRIQLFQNRLQEFWHSLIDSDVVKEFVDAGTKLIDVLDSIVNLLTKSGALNLVTGVLTGVVDLIAAITNGLDDLGAAITGILGISLFKKIKGKDSGGRAKTFALKSNQICHRIV